MLSCHSSRLSLVKKNDNFMLFQTIGIAFIRGGAFIRKNMLCGTWVLPNRDFEHVLARKQSVYFLLELSVFDQLSRKGVFIIYDRDGGKYYL